MSKIFRTLTAAALLAAAGPALSQTLLLDLNTSLPMAATLDNPCTAETEAIAFSGTTQLAQRVWLLPSGNLRLQIAENTALEGVDTLKLLGPMKYVVAGASESDYEFDPVSLSVLQFKKVNSAGLSDNFHSVLVMAFDPENLQVQLGLEAACDNGQP